MKHLFHFLCAAAILLTLSTEAHSQTKTEVDSLKAKPAKQAAASTFLQNVKITGFVQPQFQYIESAGASAISGGTFAANTSNRLIIRRGRVKATFNSENSTYVVQLNATEQAIDIDELYIAFSAPRLKTVTFTAGIFNRPYSYEIAYSSSKLEPLERSRAIRALCPGEKDMGVMITLNPGESSPLYHFTLDAGLFNGTGLLNRDFDNRKDFIGHLYYTNSIPSGNISYRLGFSLAEGGFDNQRVNHYEWNNGFVLTPNDTLAKAARNYIGVEGEFTVKWFLGTSQLRGDYYFGQQSGTLASNKTPETAPSSEAVTRDFTGGYLLFLNTLPHSKIQLAARFDWYDPNSRVAGSEIGTLPKTGKNDINFKTLGFGFNYLIDANLKFLAWYEVVKNESTLVSGYTSDQKDNLMTLRLQYKF